MAWLAGALGGGSTAGAAAGIGGAGLDAAGAAAGVGTGAGIAGSTGLGAAALKGASMLAGGAPPAGGGSGLLGKINGLLGIPGINSSAPEMGALPTTAPGNLIGPASPSTATGVAGSNPMVHNLLNVAGNQLTGGAVGVNPHGFVTFDPAKFANFLQQRAASQRQRMGQYQQ